MTALSKSSLACCSAIVLAASPADGSSPLLFDETVIAGDPSTDFGRDVSIDGDTLIVGAPGDDQVASNAGAAFIFRRGLTGVDDWTLVKKLTASDGTYLDRFGISVAIAGDTAIVSGTGDDNDGTGFGAAYVFEKDAGGADNWGEVKKLEPSNPQSTGTHVAIDGDTAVLRGGLEVIVFERDAGGLGNWGEVALIASGNFWSEIAIDGGTLVAGDQEHGSSGAVWVHDRDAGGPDNWGEVATLEPSDGSEWFGYSIAVDGDTVVVGSPYDDDLGDRAGAAYVYERNFGGAENWGEVKKKTFPDPDPNRYFASSVAISGDDAYVGNYASETVFTFSRDAGGTDNWGLTTRVVPAEAGQYSYFGRTIAVSGHVLTSGDYLDDQAYVFDPKTIRMFVTTATQPGDFGGLDGGDDICQAEADAASVGGVWQAFVSVPGTDRFLRLPEGLPVERIDRQPLAADRDDLNGPIANPLDREAGGGTAPVGSHTWTGDSDGDGNCLGFSATSGDTGGYGITSQLDNDWHAAGDDACTTSNRLYCFEFNCPLVPDSACDASWSKGNLIVKESKPGKEKFRVDFKNGPALSQADLGTPLDPSGTAYTACVYDGGDSLVAQLQVDRAAGLCSGKPCWIPIGGSPPGGKGYLYRDKNLGADGLQKIQLKGGTAGKSKLSVRAANNVSKGPPALPLMARKLLGSTQATVQLHGDDLSQCFSVTLNDVRKSTTNFFHAKK